MIIQIQAAAITVRVHLGSLIMCINTGARAMLGRPPWQDSVQALHMDAGRVTRSGHQYGSRAIKRINTSAGGPKNLEVLAWTRMWVNKHSCYGQQTRPVGP